MARTPLEHGLRLLGRAAAPGAAGVPDADLLDRFARDRDEAAFELLVWRHAGMVFGTCRRLLRDPHDAEDAAQACFLALARRAGAVGRRGPLGGWLHRVAFRVALRAQATRSRRDARRRPLDDHAPAARTPDPATAAEWREVGRALDEAVNDLPARYRVPFVLCCLEGRPAADAARDLGCAVGTVESRLTRARARLRVALNRRGIAPAAGLLATVSAGEAVLAVPPGLAAATARAAVGAGASPHVLALTEGVLHAMWLAKVKAAGAVALAVAVLGTGTGLVWHQPAAADPTAPSKSTSPDADRVAGLIQKLGSPAFADRERAARELDALGPAALDALRAAARGDDPERKKRAEELVKKIEGRASAAKVLAAKRVRLNYRDTPLAEAVADFKAKSGYDVALSDPAGALKGRTVTLDTGEVTFWQAVEQFCQAAGLEEAKPAGPRPGGGFGAGGPPRPPGAVGGGVVVGGPAAPFAPPGRVTLVDGKRAKRPSDDRTAVRVRAVPPGDAGPAAEGEALVHLEVAPEPRLRWQRTVGVDVKTATDDKGQAHDQVRSAEPAPAPAVGVGPAVAAGGVGFAPDFGGGNRIVPVRLKTGNKPASALKELSGTVAVQVLTDPEEYVAVDGILDAAGKAGKAADGGAVRVVAVSHEAGGRVKVTFGIDPPPGAAAGRLSHLSMRNGRVVLTSGPGSAGEYELALVDAKGAAVPLHSAGVSVAGGGAEYSLVCQPAADRGPAKLVCAVCRSVTLDVPFTLRDVPLP